MKNKNGIIVGGSGYVGNTFVKHFLSKSCNVIHLDLLVNNKTKSNKNYYYDYVDVTNRDSINSCYLNIKNTYKKIDVMINLFHYKGGQKLNSKKSFFKNFENYDITEWDNTINVNITGLFNIIQIFYKLMKNNNSSIINFSSTYGIVSPRFDIYGKNDVKSPLSYIASKSAIIGMTKYLAVYLSKYDIRVNCISPGGIKNKNHKKNFVKKYSQNTPLGRLMNTRELLTAVDYLSSENSTYTTGSNVVVDGGWTIW